MYQGVVPTEGPQYYYISTCGVLNYAAAVVGTVIDVDGTGNLQTSSVQREQGRSNDEKSVHTGGYCAAAGQISLVGGCTSDGAFDFSCGVDCISVTNVTKGFMDHRNHS